MSAQPDDWPSFAAELSRKTTAQVQLWSSAYDHGRISKREFYIVLTALYESTSGLLHREVSEMMAIVLKTLK